MSLNLSQIFDSSSMDVAVTKEEKAPVKTCSGSTAPLVPTSVASRADFRRPRPDEIILYFYPNSFYSQVVLTAMYHREIAFSAFILDIQKGDQFREEYLHMNPRGEVPLLNDGISKKIITETTEILRHIETPLVEAHGPSLVPTDAVQRQRAEEMATALHKLKVEALTLGSVMHRDLNIEPEGRFQPEENREMMRQYIRKRRAIYRTEILNYPEYAEQLNKKLVDIIKEWHFLEHREDYDRLIQSFEQVLDDCEEMIATRTHQMGYVAHRRHDSMKEGDKIYYGRHSIGMKDPNNGESVPENNNVKKPKDWWLCSPNLSVADCFLGVVLWRLQELGFGKRIFDTRINLKQYFEKLKDLEAFKRATNPEFLQMMGTEVEAEPAEAPETMTVERVYRPKDFPWWLVGLPIGTIAVYAIWGWMEGDPSARVLPKQQSVVQPRFR